MGQSGSPTAAEPGGAAPLEETTGARPAGRRPRSGKAPDALRTIGEVADALGIRQHVLRYWEEQFPMLRPLKRSGGRRYYRVDDIALLQAIDRLVHREGYTLRGARLVLEGKRSAARAERLIAPADVSVEGPSERAGAGIHMSGGDHNGGDLRPALQRIRDRLFDALNASV